MPPLIARQAARIAARAQRELEALVGVSSPSGHLHGAEESIALCQAFLPDEARLQRVACSTAGGAPDLIARLAGSGTRRLLLLGHVDTVHGHSDHVKLRREGDRLYGSGTADMKGGVVLALGVAGAPAETARAPRAVFPLLSDEGVVDFTVCAGVPAFAGYDACLCFEAGEHTEQGEEGVVVVRKGAGTLRVRASADPPTRARRRRTAPAHCSRSPGSPDLAALEDPSGPAG